MALFNNKFASIRQDWNTPRPLFDKLNKEFNFEWDLAATKENALCNKFYSKENDGLKQKWSGNCWCNPPYGDRNSKMVDWIKKSYNDTQSNLNLTVVMLIPNRSNTNWFVNYIAKSHEVRFITGRPRFGNTIHGLPQPLLIVIFKKSETPTKWCCWKYEEKI
jgi:site-specific DNA-methyltransferase (adenine-specific)